MKNINFKKVIPLFCSVISFPTLLCITSCFNKINETKQEAETEDPFIGFKNNEIIYDFPVVDGDPIKKSVPIIKVSNYLYRTAQPLDLFTSYSASPVKYGFSFTVLVASESVSTKCLFFLDEKVKNHSISLIGTKDYINHMPQFNVYNAYNKYDTIYVNLECNKKIFFEINCRIWEDFKPSGFEFYYNRVSPADKHSVLYDVTLQHYECTLLCHSNGYKANSVTTITINAQPRIYEYCNLFLKLNCTTEIGKFAPAFNMTLSQKRNIIDNRVSYDIQISYTFLKDITPTKDECDGKTPTIYSLDAYSVDEGQHEGGILLRSCVFKILWI